MRWTTYFSIALATVVVAGAQSSMTAEAGGKARGERTHRVVKSDRSHAELRALFARVPRQPYVSPARERVDHAARRAAAARAHAELRALFAPVPRQRYVAPQRKSYVSHVAKRSRRGGLLSMFTRSHYKSTVRKSRGKTYAKHDRRKH